MAQTGGPNAARGLPRRVVNRKPPRRITRPAAVFGQLGRADAPIVRAQHRAQRQTRRAQAPILRRISVPYAPKLAHPTPAQRTAAVQIVGRGLKKQRVTTPEVRALARGQGTRTAQQRTNRYLGGFQTTQRRIQASVGAQTDAQGTQRQLAQVGRAVSRNLRAQATPYTDSHRRVVLPGATIDLTAGSQAIATRLAGNPLSAFAKGLNAIALQRPFSDKGVLTRSLNDALTFPAAAIPTAYQAVTHPGQLASGIIDQVSHPIALTKEHPLFGAMLLHGGVSALGRTAGAVGRAAGADFASTSRPMVALAGESGARLRTPRSYSKDVFRKAGQVAYDATLKPVRDAKGNVVKDARGRPVLVAPARKSERLQKQRADFIVSRANARERHARAEASRQVMLAQPTRGGGRVSQAIDRSLAAQPATGARILPKKLYRPEKDVVAMAMEGTLRSPETFHADLLKERTRLENVYQRAKRGEIELDPLEKRTNRIRARTIDRVINDKRALSNAEGVFQSARTLAAQGNEVSRRLVENKILDPAAAARAKLFPYAQSHMGAQVVEHQDGTRSLRAADGTFLSNLQIETHMRSPDTGPVVDPANIAHLTHRQDVRGARAYHQQFRLNRPNLDQQSRTGAAYEKGATDTSFDLPLEQIVRGTTTLTRAHEFDRLIGDVGIKHPSGRYFTWKEAEQYARHGGRAPNEATNQRLPGEPQLVPVRALPAKYDEARSKAIQNEQDASVPGASDRLVREQTARFDGPDPADPGARNVVLVPKEVADRIQENLKPSTSFDKTFQGVTSAFRTTVLPFSTKWLTGNVVEAVLRSGVAGVSPHDPLIGRKLVKEMAKQDPEGAAQIVSHLLGGLLYGEKGLTNRRAGQEIAGNVGGMISHSLPGRAVGGAIKGATSPIFAFNKGLEQTSQYAVLGKYARRQMQEMTGSWFKAMRAQEGALKDLAEGLRNTENQQAAARYLDETLGKYSRFSPGMRRAIQGYAPFLPWYLNSVRFVLHTLPVRHPVKTAVLTQAEAAFQKDWEAQHKGVPAGLKTAIPHKGGFVDAARYTPFGLLGPAAAGDLGAASGVILPQTQGLQLGILGLDPFGRPLEVEKSAANPRGKPTAAQTLLYGANQAAEEFIPGLGLVRRAREGGRKSLAGSTVVAPKTAEPKAGQPKVSAPNRIFNPFRPVYISQSRAGGKKDPLAEKYGLKSATSVDDLQKKYGLKSGKTVDDLAAKYGVK